MSAPNLLSLIVWMPIIGAFALLAWPQSRLRAVQAVGAAWSIAVVAIAATLLRYDRTAGGLQFVEDKTWLPWLGARYALGVDGLGVLLVVMAAAVVAVAIVATSSVQKRPRAYVASLLALETTVLGALASADALLLACFWLASVAPAYALVALWGGERCERAAIGVLVAGVASGAALLVAVLALHAVTTTAQTIGAAPSIELASVPLVGTGEGARAMLDSAFASMRSGTGTCNVFALHAVALARLESSASVLSASEQAAIFVLLVGACALRLGLVPFHGWLRAAVEHAPVAVSVALAGAYSSLGGYGLMRLALPLAPEIARGRSVMTGLAISASVGMVWAGLRALSTAVVSDGLGAFAGSACVALGGLVALGCVSASPVGLAGAAVALVARAASIGGLVVLARSDGWGNILRRVAAALFATATACAPPAMGFVGAAMAISATASNGRLPAVAAVVGLVVMAGGAVCVSVGLWSRDGDASARLGEAVGVGVLAVVTVTLGVVPRPAIALVERSVQLVAYQVWHEPGRDDRYEPTLEEQPRNETALPPPPPEPGGAAP